MYTLIDPKSFWPQVPMPSMQSNQIFMAPVPATPTYLIGGTPQVLPMPNQSPPMFYSVQPTWYSQPCIQTMPTSSRPRTSSDDVFIFDNSTCHQKGMPTPYIKSLPKRRQRFTGAIEDMSLESRSTKNSSRERRPSGANSESSIGSSHQSDGGFSASSRGSSGSNRTDNNSIESLNHSSESTSHKETTGLHLDHSLYNVFSTSLYTALNRDPPEPSVPCGGKKVIPLKTSSPIRDEKSSSEPMQVDTLRSVPDNWSPKDLEANIQTHGIDDNDNLDSQGSNRRQKFLHALEVERERQRSLVLPRHAPKMNCKFCKNNGESSEVYTKHRLHFKEKTVCPLLRLYVCRLCNSTGDFAHTIKHCPFNERFDKIAWKATFL